VTVGAATLLASSLAMVLGTGAASATALTAGQLAVVAGPFINQLPYGVAVNAGNIYLSDLQNSKVEEVSSTGVYSVIAGGGGTTPTLSNTPMSATSAMLSYTSGVAVTSGGTVYIADFLDNLVEKVTTGGQLSVLAGGGSTVPTPGNSPMAATSALLSQPKAVAVDSSGNVYFADTAHNEIDKVTTGGQLSVIAGGGSTVPTLSNSPVTATTALLSSPTGVAISSSGNLYISDDSHNLIEEVTNPGVSGALSVVAGGGSTVPSTTPALATSVLTLWSSSRQLGERVLFELRRRRPR
jgi:hypothetical protein